ncbi:MAG: hypothetical protein PHV54_01635 [Tolumonas sp.]|nr:hypothetical protein [Tolumonas sp.]
MARARNIKPGFFANDELGECNPLTRLMFIGMWTMADKKGRMEDRPKRIKATTLPYDNADCDELLNELVKHGFIIRYSVGENGYIQIINWDKHQNPHVKESASEIPEFVQQPTEINQESARIIKEQCSNEQSTIQAPVLHDANPADSLNLIPDSLNLIPDSLNLIPDSLNLIPSEEICSQQTFVSAEQATGKQELSDDPIVITILTNTGDEWPVTESLVKQMTELYPAVNVRQEFRNISGWAIGNQKKRKTKSGMMKFITAWMSRAQNSGGSKVIDFTPRNQPIRQDGFAHTGEPSCTVGKI